MEPLLGGGTVLGVQGVCDVLPGDCVLVDVLPGWVAVPEPVAVPVVVQGACTGVVLGDVGVVFGAMVPGEVCVDGCVPGVLVPFAGTVPGVVVPVLPGDVVLPGV